MNAFRGNGISAEEKAELVYFHPGFAETRSIVLHRSGVDPGYDVWRRRVSNLLVAHRMETSTSRDKPNHPFHGGLIHHIALHMTQRNPTALYGAGLIDSLPAEALYEAARQQPSEIRGRVSRATAGVVGRFGWKAQTATLHDFVLSACANELGLEVPGHHQGTSPLAPFEAAKGLDLTEEECDALVAYVRNLRSPAVVEPSGPRESVGSLQPGWSSFFTGIGYARVRYEPLARFKASTVTCCSTTWAGHSATPALTMAPPRRPVPRAARSGGRRRYGGSATPGRIFMMGAPIRSMMRCRGTGARACTRHGGS